jgi:hypothetical protein
MSRSPWLASLLAIALLSPSVVLAQTDMPRGGRPVPGRGGPSPGPRGYGPGGGPDYGYDCPGCGYGYGGIIGSYNSGNPIPTMPEPPPRLQGESRNGVWYY